MVWKFDLYFYRQIKFGSNLISVNGSPDNLFVRQFFEAVFFVFFLFWN